MWPSPTISPPARRLEMEGTTQKGSLAPTTSGNKIVGRPILP